VGKAKEHRNQPVTIQGHVRELLLRLLAVFIALLVTGIVIYVFYQPILAFLSEPLHAPLYYSSPAGGFTYVMKICLMGGIIISIPLFLYNIIMFIRPALSKTVSTKKILTTVGTSSILALAGAAFAFYIIVPESLSFFKDYQVSGLQSLMSADSYLNFITGIMMMFALIFQIPLVISFIDHIKPFNIGKMLKADKWVILGSLIITLLQPFTYDLMTSLLIAFSMVAVYNMSIIAAAFQHSQEKRLLKNSVKSTIVKPIATQEFNLNDQTIGSFCEELTNLDKFKPKQVATMTNRPSMDVKPTVVRVDTTIKPAAWVEERKAQRAAINSSSNKRAFSDFSKVSKCRPMPIQTTIKAPQIPPVQYRRKLVSF